jgi:dihydrofolate synthase/folylpolyglutamate synthase
MKNKDFIQYANSFQTVPNLGLNRISNLLDKLGNPQNSLKFIHLAGTNGKGSVCSFLQSILTNAGYKTGKFISPNMLSVNERITIDGTQINNGDLEKLLLDMKELSEQVFSEIDETPSQFEIWTAVAVAYFKKEKCDIVILETGLGGRFDATNVILTPLLSIITRIDLDHTDLLGDTTTKIAYEKAGIIKQNGTTITIPQENEAMETIKEVAKNLNNRLIVTDIPAIHTPNYINECFSYKNFENLICGLGGLHQVENATLAIEAAVQLNIPEEHIIYGIKNAKNIGRFELISKDPVIIFDGAHNVNGIIALTKSLDRYYKTEKKTFIMAFMGDKDIKQILKHTNADNYYFTKVQDNERGLSEDKLYHIAKEIGITGKIFSDIKSALAKKNNGGITVICGSLYLYKDLF